MLLGRLGLAAAAALATVGCAHDPLGVKTCDVELEGACWTLLGLHQASVLALIESHLYAATWNGVLRFEPERGGWFPVGWPPLEKVTTILHVPGNPPRLLAGLYRGEPIGEASLYATEDYKTWLPSDRGLNPDGGYRGVDALALDPHDSQRLYLATDYPILRSDNGGRDWRYVYGTPHWFGHGTTALVASKHRPGRIWAGLNSGLGGALVVRSLDGGATWKGVLGTKSLGWVYTVAEDRKRPDRIWVSLDDQGGGSGLYVADDGGETWTLALSEPVSELAFIGDSILAAGFDLVPGTSPARLRLRLFLSPTTCLCWQELPVPDGISFASTSLVDDRGRLILGTLSGVWVVTFGQRRTN